MATKFDNSPIARHAGAGFGHEDRLRRAKYLGALADRLFRNECARLGLDANEAIKSPLLSIITRHALLRLQAVSSKTSRPSQRSDRIAISS
jgi:hypothetical protein